MKKEVSVIAHNIRSLHNVGALLRTSDAAGVSKVYLTGYTGVPPRREISKTALGADEYVEWEYHKDPLVLLRRLKKKGVVLVALERNQESQDIGGFKTASPLAMVIGNEVEGVEPALLELCDEVLHIPMRGKKESLNVSVAFGIGIYALTSRF